MPFPGFDNHLRISNFFNFGGEQRTKLFAYLGFNSSGATIGDNPLGIQSAKVRARSHIAGPQLQAKPEGFDYSTAHLEFQRIVTKQRKMARPTSRRNARP